MSPRGGDTKGWSLRSTPQFVSEKETDDVSVGVKCGKEGHKGVVGPGAGVPNVLRGG